MSKILAIIPARGGSKRIPGKNKQKLGGKELVRYAIEASLASSRITQVVLSSDDADILAIGKTYDQLISLERPAEISGDLAPAITYVQDTLNRLPAEYNYVVIIQPSSPFTQPEDIDATLDLLVDSDANSAVSVMKLDHAIQPAKLKTLSESGVLHPYLEEEAGRMAAHELPELYVRNGSVYAATTASIREGNIIGPICLAYEMPRERSVDINDPIDFEFAEFLMKRKQGDLKVATL